MPSLKDLRNRITSVKATRKITKAMQMVAAAKLRRAQETVTAARPYADRMDQMIASVGARITDKGATPLLSGTGRDQVHLMVVMTGERGLAGGFNTNISKLARLDAQRLLAQGKTVKMLMVGRKGAEALKREFGSYYLDRIDLRAVRQIAFANADEIAQRLLKLYEAGEFDIATLYFSEFKIVITQKPIGAAAHSRQAARRQAARHGQRRGDPRVRAERGRGPRRSRDAQHLDADLPRPAGERRLLLRRADERHGLGDPQCRRDDRQADAPLQPHAPGDDHQRAH